MMPKMIRTFVLLSLGTLLGAVAFAAGNSGVPLMKAHVDLKDKAMLQRGAKWYMNYCAGCHSLQYTRYQGMAKDIGLVGPQGKVDANLLKQNLIFPKAGIYDPILTAMPKADSREWFGVEPPDLSLETRFRGVNWVYSYLMSFYKDPSRPFGVNNRLYPDVAMPNVLGVLQGDQMPAYVTKTIPYDGQTKEIKMIDHLQLLQDGSMSEHQFASMINDLVTFMAYVGEPVALDRIHLGIYVMLFLLGFLILAYLLKKAFWRDVK